MLDVSKLRDLVRDIETQIVRIEDTEPEPPSVSRVQIAAVVAIRNSLTRLKREIDAVERDATLTKECP